jgi:phosphodiesterase/alkaline phosphatase D-like protein
VIHRIAFGSCAKHWQHQSIWDAVIAKKPDLFLFLGDAIYADTDGTTAWSVTEEQVEIDWAAEPSPLVAFETVDVNGSIRFEHRVSLSALRATD